MILKQASHWRRRASDSRDDSVTCEPVNASVAMYGISASNSQSNFTSVIAKSVVDKLRRRLVFPTLCLEQVFILSKELPDSGPGTQIADESWSVHFVQHADHASGIKLLAALKRYQ